MLSMGAFCLRRWGVDLIEVDRLVVGSYELVSGPPACSSEVSESAAKHAGHIVICGEDGASYCFAHDTWTCLAVCYGQVRAVPALPRDLSGSE